MMSEREKGALKFAFVIFIIIIVGAVIYSTLSKGASDKYLIINETAIFEKNKKEFKQVVKPTDNVLKQKYTVYSDSGVNENVSLQYTSNDWYYFNDSYKDLELKKVRVATNIDGISLASYESGYYDDSDYSVLATSLSKSGVKKIDSFKNQTRKISYDFDNDGVNEIIYTTTNYSLSFVDEVNVSKMFMVKNGSVVQEIAKNESSPYSVIEVLDIDSDGNYEMVVSKGDVDIKSFDTCYQIYKFNNGKWELKQDCR